MDPLQRSSNWDPLIFSRITKWDQFNIYLQFSRGPTCKNPPIGIRPTFHRPIHQINGPTTMQQQLGPTYNFAGYEMERFSKYLQFSIGPTCKNSSNWNGTLLSTYYSSDKWTHCNAAAFGTHLQIRGLRNGTHM